MADPRSFCNAYGCPHPVVTAVVYPATLSGAALTAYYCATHTARLRAEGEEARAEFHDLR